MISMGVKGVRSDSKSKFDEYIYHRNKAFMTFDFKRISECMVKYGNRPPTDNAEFWVYVAQTVLDMKDAPAKAVREAIKVLDELNLKEDATDGSRNG